MDLAALKAELTDPTYASLDDVAAADAINKVDRKTDKDSIQSGDLAAAIVAADLSDMTEANFRWLSLLMMAGSFPATKEVKQQLRALFMDGKPSQKTVREVLKRDGSRADELGLGRITPSDIADARRPQ